MINELNQTLSVFLESINNAIPENIKPYFVLAFFTLGIVVFSIFVWKFYKFLAKRDILELKLNKYNVSEHYIIDKVIAFSLYILEYIIIIPILISLWFAFLAMFFLLMAETDINNILLFSAAIIAATRVLSYYSKDLSKELGLMFPFTLLIVILLEPGVVSLEQILARFTEIPTLFETIIAYILFIAGLEVLMRIIFSIIPKEDDED